MEITGVGAGGTGAMSTAGTTGAQPAGESAVTSTQSTTRSESLIMTDRGGGEAEVMQAAGMALAMMLLEMLGGKKKEEDGEQQNALALALLSNLGGQRSSSMLYSASVTEQTSTSVSPQGVQATYDATPQADCGAGFSAEA